MDHSDFIENMAKAWLDYQNVIAEIVKPLSDNEAREAIDLLRKEGEGSLCADIYNNQADTIESELRFRKMFEIANKHEIETGETSYCFHCGGTCKPEHYENE